MVDLVQTAANVVKGSNAKVTPGTIGETVTAGMCAVRDATTKKFMKSDSNAATTLRRVDGIFLNSGSLNQPCMIQTEGQINLGATLVVGERYFLSDTAGQIIPSADVSTGEQVVYLGTAISTSLLDLKIHNPGVAMP